MVLGEGFPSARRRRRRRYDSLRAAARAPALRLVRSHRPGRGHRRRREEKLGVVRKVVALHRQSPREVKIVPHRGPPGRARARRRGCPRRRRDVVPGGRSIGKRIPNLRRAAFALQTRVQRRDAPVVPRRKHGAVRGPSRQVRVFLGGVARAAARAAGGVERLEHRV